MAGFQLVPLEMAWFTENINEYIEREEFIEFQEIVGFDYAGIIDTAKIREIADRICDHSSIFHEIRRAKGGAFFPEKVYRKDVNFFNAAPNWIPRADELILYRPMCYSLYMRFQSLSNSIIPYIFDTRFGSRDGIVIGNLGSGLGRDLHEPVRRYDGLVRRVINVDTDQDAIKIGIRELPKDIAEKVAFYEGNLLKENPEGEKYDFCLLVGVICPLTDESAELLLGQIYQQMAEGGHIAVSSSSYKMHRHDPICSINIQLTSHWALNCRTEETLFRLLKNAGFCNIEVLTEPSGYNLIGIGAKK